MPRPLPFNNTELNDTELNSRTVDVIGDLNALNTLYFPNSNLVAAINAVPSMMSKTFYVDSINGNDSNDGSSSAPFKTIKKAVDSIPAGGVADIYLTAGQTYTIDSHINIVNKRVRIVGDKDSHPVIKNTSYLNQENSIETTGFLINKGQLIFINCDIQTANYPSGATSLGYLEGFISRFDYLFGSVQFFECNINLGDIDLIRLPSGPATLFIDLWRTTIRRNGANRNAYVVWNEVGVFTLGAVNVDLGTLTWNDLIVGIVRDSNGVPRNVISNIIL